MKVAGVILAAGASTRFGSRKQLVRLGPTTMLGTVARLAHEAGLQPVIAVVPPGVAVPPDVVPVINDAPDEGISRSLRLGIAAVPLDEADAALILLADQPTVRPETIRAIVGAARADRPIVAAHANGHHAPPVLVHKEAFAVVREATGDEGLRALLAARPEMVISVEVGEHAPDVDRPADLDAVAPPCPGCGARLAAPPGTPTHPYIGASPGCWIRWTELQGSGAAVLGRHATDAYAAQHPGVDGRRQRQSVAVHLIALCHWLEHGIGDPRLTELTQAILAGKPEWPWLTPPDTDAISVHDLLDPASPTETRRWVEAVWDAWTPHHATVRRWAAEALSRRPHR